jgi:hypothetical protein
VVNMVSEHTVSPVVTDDDDDDDDNNNNNSFNSLFICVPTQPKGQLRSEHDWKKGNKHTQSTRQGQIIIII